MRRFSDGWGEPDNPHLWLLAFCAGVIALRFCAELPALWLAVTAAAVTAACAIRWRWWRPVAAAALGFCWAVVVAAQLLATGLPAALEKQDVTVTGRVVGVPAAGDGWQRFDFQVKRLEHRGAAHASPGKIRLKLYRDTPRIRSGQRWRFTVRLKRARGFSNPGALFNYETHLFHHRLRATGYVRARPPPQPLAAPDSRGAHAVAASAAAAAAAAISVFRARAADFIRDSLSDNGGDDGDGDNNRGDEGDGDGDDGDGNDNRGDDDDGDGNNDNRGDDGDGNDNDNTEKNATRAGLVTALAVGIRSDMRAADWEVLVRTGTIHLVAISGLHIGMVAGLVMFLGGRVWRFAGALPLKLPAPQAGVAAGLLAGIVYALLAGMTIPTQRAVCMLAAVAAALFFSRRAFAAETWVLALAVVLAFDPLAPLAAGFWLSFGAVAVLVLGVARARRSGDAESKLAHRALHTFGAWSWIQLLLFIGMAPLLLALFHRVSLAAPLANLAAIPVIGMGAVPAALAGLALFAAGLETAAAWAFQASAWIIDALWWALEYLAAQPGSVWRRPAPQAWTVLAAAVGVLLLLAPRALPARRTGLLWFVPLLVAPGVDMGGGSGRDALGRGEFKYTMLEVGHGLASVVQTRNHLLVYDAGPRFAGGFDAGESVLAPFLRQTGAARIDALVVSHGDNDHSGGHRALLAQFEARRILTSAPAAVAGAMRCMAGQRWEWDGVIFEILWPPAPPRAAGLSGNDASCVLKVHSRFGGALLTGDIGKAAEEALVAGGANLAAEVLQAPHHGSKTSSTEAFLARVNPKFALASIGYLNRYGHPHESVRARYQRRRIPVYHTANEGGIETAFLRDGITLQAQRAADRKYWLLPATQLTQAIHFTPRN